MKKNNKSGELGVIRYLQNLRREVRKRKRFVVEGANKKFIGAKSNRKRVVILAPEIFYVGSEAIRGNVIGFLSSIRASVLAGVKKIHICFRQAREMRPCGTLLFVAEIDRLVKLYPLVRFSCSYPKIKKVEKVLQQIGCLSLFKKGERCTITEDDKDVVNWRYCTGVDANTESLIGWMDEVNEIISRSAGKKLGTGISEAMTNCAHHAYEAHRQDGMLSFVERRWWMFAEIIDERLVVVFCDLGIGIPRSLRANWSELILKNLKFTSDEKHEGEMIEASFEIGRTRTGQEKHGKGMNDLKRVIDITKSGYLVVHSNFGRFNYAYHNGAIDRNTTGYKTSILGTLIQWSIPVSEVSHLA